MSQLNVRTLMTALADTAKTAWSPAKIILGEPYLPQLAESLPVVGIGWRNTAGEFGGARLVRHGHEFEIRARFAFPADKRDYVALEKADRVNEFMALFEADAHFSDASMPIITSIDPSEDNNLQEDTYELSFVCSLTTIDQHH